MTKKRSGAVGSGKADGPSKFSRREFLSLAAMGGMGLLIVGCKDNSPDEFPQDPSLPENYTKAMVIGTGFGGAIAAYRLGQAGVDTMMLERGKSWEVNRGQNNDVFARNLDGANEIHKGIWLNDHTVMPVVPETAVNQRYIGTLERMDFQNIQVYAGAGVGGGSLVYGGMTVRPHGPFFNEQFPPEITYSEMESKWFPMVEDILSVSTLPDYLYNSEYFKYTKVSEAHGKNVPNVDPFKLNACVDWDIIRAEFDGDIRKEALVGELIYGANNGYKNSLDYNYIPMAKSTGHVIVKTQHQAREVGITEDGFYYVDVDIIDEGGNTIEQKRFHCSKLFMGAGSVNSTRLLVKAREKGTLPGLNDKVGTNWGTNGNAMFIRSLVLDDIGNTQANPPAVGLQDFSNPINPCIVECAPLPIDLAELLNLPPLLQNVTLTSLMYLAVTKDTGRGSFTYNPGTDEVEVDWPSDGNASSKAAARDLVNRLNAANSGILDTTILNDAPTDHFTYHPLGGCSLGEATDLYGRVKGYDGLYVVDGAMMPGTSGCANPSLTIAALAERCLENIITYDDFS